MKRFLRPDWLIVALLLVLAFVAVLVTPSGLVYSGPFTDLPAQFASWRAFAASSLKAGHFPLWNPYTFSGEPFLGGFQSALFYPLNVIFLFLPLDRALNFSMLLHLVILGWGMYRWAIRRGLHPAAAVLCGFALPLSGAVFPHMYAGHLSNLCTMAWAPWILAGMESWWRDRRVAGFFEASAAICLQIFAGHTQYVFFTGVAVGLDALVLSVTDPSVRRRALPVAAACYAAAAALAAAQLLPGFAATAESVRQTKLSFAEASTYFFPWENFTSFFVPRFLQYPVDLSNNILVYWGRWYSSEVTAYIGAAGVALAWVGMMAAARRREVWRDAAVAALMLLFAVGVETPLYRFLYDDVPGFGQIRGMSKFIFQAMLFIVLAAGAGIDVLIRRLPVRRLVAFVVIGAGLLVVGAGVSLWLNPEPVVEFSQRAQQDGSNQLEPEAYKDLSYVRRAGLHTGTLLIFAGSTFLLVGGSLAGLPRWPGLRWVALVVFPLEMAAFAYQNFAAASLYFITPDTIRSFFAKVPGDYRVLDLESPQTGADNGFLVGAPDIWGNDPLVSRRYAEFITATQGYDPNQATQYIREFKGMPPIYAILRCKYVVRAADNQLKIFRGVAQPMAQAQLISDYRIGHDRGQIFRALAAPDFDPRRTVILESDPEPRPVPNPHPGTVRIVNLSSDELMVEADVATPTLLLITDPYSRDWRAVPLAGSSQQSYTVLPADYVVRAVPLAAGHQHLLMEYSPPSFRIGLGVSLAAFLLWIGAAVGLRGRERRREPAV